MLIGMDVLIGSIVLLLIVAIVNTLRIQVVGKQCVKVKDLLETSLAIETQCRIAGDTQLLGMVDRVTNILVNGKSNNGVNKKENNVTQPEELSLEEKKQEVLEAAQKAIDLALQHGLVLTIESESLKPFAMGNIRMVPKINLGRRYYRPE